MFENFRNIMQNFSGMIPMSILPAQSAYPKAGISDKESYIRLLAMLKPSIVFKENMYSIQKEGVLQVYEFFYKKVHYIHTRIISKDEFPEELRSQIVYMSETDLKVKPASEATDFFTSENIAPGLDENKSIPNKESLQKIITFFNEENNYFDDNRISLQTEFFLGHFH